MGIRSALALGALAIVALIGFFVDRHFSEDKRIRDENSVLVAWQGDTVEAVKEATGNRKSTAETAIGQIRAFGDSYRALRIELDSTNQTLVEMAQEAARLKAKAVELRKIADKAERQRAAAYKRLSDMALSPGDREDCMAMLRDAEEALDIAREAGL